MHKMKKLLQKTVMSAFLDSKHYCSESYSCGRDVPMMAQLAVAVGRNSCH